MKTGRIKTLICLIAFACVAVCTVFFMGSSCIFASDYTVNDVAKILADDWGMDLPKEGAEVIYSQCKLSFPSDGEDYFVIDYEDYPEDFIELSFNADSEFEEFVDSWLKYLERESKQEIPIAFFPDWEKEYGWYYFRSAETTNCLCIFKFADSTELYVLIVYF